MTTQEITDYYNATEKRETREDLVYAANIVEEPKIAIDCGCGAGSDITYLSEQGFTVHAFDIEDESIARCKKRFQHNENVFIYKAHFESFKYPTASLIVADASLFFCATSKFNTAWQKIYNSLVSGGIFCGSFLGPEDTMAGPDYDRKNFWPDVLVFDELQVKEQLANYHILRFTEHKTSGKTPDGKKHNWHIYSVVAKKD